MDSSNLNPKRVEITKNGDMNHIFEWKNSKINSLCLGYVRKHIEIGVPDI